MMSDCLWESVCKDTITLVHASMDALTILHWFIVMFF